MLVDSVATVVGSVAGFVVAVGSDLVVDSDVVDVDTS